MKSVAKRLFSVLLACSMLFGMVQIIQTQAFAVSEDELCSSAMIGDSSSGTAQCVSYSCLFMERRRVAIEASLTEAKNIKKADFLKSSWTGSTPTSGGTPDSFTFATANTSFDFKRVRLYDHKNAYDIIDYATNDQGLKEITGGHAIRGGSEANTPTDSATLLKALCYLLDKHKEGIVIWDGDYPHAVLALYYEIENGETVVYCADPAKSDLIVKLGNTVMTGKTRDEELAHINSLWVITNADLSKDAGITGETSTKAGNGSVSINDFNARLKDYIDNVYPAGSVYNDSGAPDGGYQCFGFANNIAKYIFGLSKNPSTSGSFATYDKDNWEVTRGSGALNNLHVGDIVRFRTAGDDHSIFVTNITDSEVFFSDANWNHASEGDNKVRHNASFTKAYLRERLDVALKGNPDLIGYVAHYKGWDIGGNVPEAPTGINGVWLANSSGYSQAVISWNAIPNATFYEVEYKTPRTNNQWKTDSDYSSGTSYTSKGLATYDSYPYRVRAVNSAGKSDWVELTIYKEITIGLNANGGTVSQSGTKVKYNAGKLATIGTLPTPTRDGYTFSGWYTAIDGGSEIKSGFSTNSTKDFTLYARWTQNTEQNLIKVSSISIDKSELALKVGDKASFTATILPKNATNKNVYWWSNNESVVTIDQNGNVLAVAPGTAVIDAESYDGNYKAFCTITVSDVIYTLNYDANGGSNAPETQNKIKGKSLILSSVKPVRNGYKFLGWAINVNAYSAEYAPGSVFQIDANTTLYAVWQKAEIKKLPPDRINEYKPGMFEDISEGQWYTGEVASAYEMGLMKGLGNNQFGLAGKVSVIEAITMASRIHSLYFNGYEDFDQSQGSHWYDTYLNYAYNTGIIGSKYYNSDVTRVATRLEFAEILANSLPSVGLEAINNVDDDAIPDVGINDTAADAVYKLYRAGVLAGNDANGVFYPSSDILRIEAAAIVSRIADPVNRKNITLIKSAESSGIKKVNLPDGRYDAVIEKKDIDYTNNGRTILRDVHIWSDVVFSDEFINSLYIGQRIDLSNYNALDDSIVVSDTRKQISRFDGSEYIDIDSDYWLTKDGKYWYLETMNNQRIQYVSFIDDIYLSKDTKFIDASTYGQDKAVSNMNGLFDVWKSDIEWLVITVNNGEVTEIRLPFIPVR